MESLVVVIVQQAQAERPLRARDHWHFDNHYKRLRRLMRKSFGATTNPATNTYRCTINFCDDICHRKLVYF